MRHALLASLFVMTPFLIAQTLTVTPIASQPAMTASTSPPSPALRIDDADPAARSAVRLEALHIHATLNAPLAQTTVTLTFKNTLNRPLEGTLEFPLPENAAVVGYALDVPAGSGTLIEGVCVEKERARRIFETEQRQRIDPGLVEHTRGNNYRTRVHPIPPNGTRTVQLTYISDLVHAASDLIYSLPLEYAGTLSSGKLTVEVVGNHAAQNLQIAGLPGIAFKPSESSQYPALIAEKSFGNVKLSGNLTVTLPPLPATFARVERRMKRPSVEDVLASKPGDLEAYFLISTTVPHSATPPRPLHHIGILWDTSLSRATADRAPEFATLRALAARFPDATFYAFSTDGTPLKSAPARDSDAFLAYLNDLPCDGALRIDGLRAKLESAPRLNTNQPRPDLYLFFTDGLITLGPRELRRIDAPVFTLSSDPRADHALLKTLAESNGGRYLNLQRLSGDAAISTLISPTVPISLEWDAFKPLIDQVQPAGPVAAAPGERVTFTGRLLAPQATVRLNGTPLTLTQEGAPATGLVPRFWAQQKAAALATDPLRNHDALLALGKDFSIVTPITSLLVLETVDQYVRHRVVPPQSAKSLYDEFVKRIESESTLARQQEQDKINHVLALWNKRIDWWNTSFTPPTKEQVAARARRIRDLGGAAAPDAMPSTGVPLPATPAGAAAREPQRPALVAGAGEERLSRLLQEGHADAPAPLEDTGASDATITIKPWSPDTPYLRALKAAPPDASYTTYLAQRKDHFGSPAFYLDCANFFLDQNQPDLAIRILTNIAQLRLEDAALLRVAAYRLLQIGQHALAIDLFEQVKTLRPDEPQSWRDLALAYAARAGARAMISSTPGHPPILSDYARAFELLHHVVMNKWDRFDEIEVIALMDANSLWTAAARFDVNKQLHNPFDPRLIKNLDCDLRILLTWDADVTDIDLHITEPSTETANYSHNLTLSGGLVSRDFTEGYGPEEYIIRHAPPGPYKIMANYYGSSQQSLQGPITVQATVITHFGRPTESRQSLTLRLTTEKETVTIGEVQFTPR